MVPVFDPPFCILLIKSKYYKLGTAIAICGLFGKPVVLCDMPGQVDISVQRMLPPAWNHHSNRALMGAHEQWGIYM
jgi:hypothetical protein